MLPKPLLPVGDRPILEIVIAQLRDAGVDEIVLATGYLSGLIEAYFGDGEAFDVSITYTREDTPLGTVGPLANIDGLDETFVLMNGDVLSDLPMEDMIEAHTNSGAVATVATHVETVEIDYGVLSLGAPDGRVAPIESIDEKPKFVLDVSMGVYCFEPEVIDFIQAGERSDFPDLIGSLIDAGRPVSSYRHTGQWVDVGSMNHLEGVVQELEKSAEKVVARAAADPRALKRSQKR